MGKHPNIVLLVADQMRGDCLGFAGHPDVKTPGLDTLADSGVYFPNAYSATPSCIPARAELLTGLSQRKHGRVGYLDGVRWEYPITLAGELSKEGYYTQCVGKMHVHPLRSSQGFHNIELHDGQLEYYRRADSPSYENQHIADDYFHWLKQQKSPAIDTADTGLGCNSYVARPWPWAENLHPTNWVSTRSIDFLRRRDRDKPFFLMASYVRPHAPLDAPQCYFDMYANKELRPPVTGSWQLEGLSATGRNQEAMVASKDDELVRQQMVGYYACITHIDHQISRIVYELKAQGIMEDTIIIFTADHGDELCDHGLNRKAFPYQGSVHIPLIISGDKLPHQKVDTRLAALRDIMPTCLNIAGGRQALSDGQNLLQAAQREYIHGEHAYGEFSNHFIVTQDDKYIWYSQSGREQYFNLRQDPKEIKDCVTYPQYAQCITNLRQVLVKELTGREEGYTDGEKLVVGRTPQYVLQESLSAK